MPPLEHELSSKPGQPAPGQSLAVAAESLYLINLLLLPGIGFLILTFLYFRTPQSAPALAREHMRQAWYGSLWAGSALVIINGALIVLGGIDSAYTWVAVGLYFIVVHAAFVMVGIFGLAKAMAGSPYRYPLLGPRAGKESHA